MVICDVNDIGDNFDGCDSSTWHDWGRWAVLGVFLGAMVLAIAGFVLFSYISSRRRMRAGVKPMYGTAWAAPPPYSATDPNAKGEPAPAYSLESPMPNRPAAVAAV